MKRKIKNHADEDFDYERERENALAEAIAWGEGGNERKNQMVKIKVDWLMVENPVGVFVAAAPSLFEDEVREQIDDYLAEIGHAESFYSISGFFIENGDVDALAADLRECVRDGDFKVEISTIAINAEITPPDIVRLSLDESGIDSTLTVEIPLCSHKSLVPRLVRDFVGAYRSTTSTCSPNEVYTFQTSGYGWADSDVLDFLQALKSAGAVVLTDWKLADRKAQTR